MTMESENWDAIFTHPDPYSYGDLYERTKRAHTLEMLPAKRFNRALEIGCAEGHFTIELAKRADRVTALDISSKALFRAAARCASSPQVVFKQGDAFEQLPEGLFDLIVAGEVLYYSQHRFALRSTARRIVASLEESGYVLLTHANNVADDRGNTGFDFQEMGSRFICREFSRTPGLQFVGELRTDLYRVQLFQKRLGPRRQRCPLEVIVRDARFTDKDKVSRLIKWGGCDVTEAEARHLWSSPEINVLMYHRVADTGPERLSPYRVAPRQFERQLSYLRRQGFQSISIHDAFQALNAGHQPPQGRLVVFTFDDAYRDFYECAWPLLKRYGFSATVFVPVSFVGGCAEWDQGYGEPAALMSWDEIRTAQQEGVQFGSHSLTHRRVTEIEPHEIWHELSASRDVLEKELGVRPTAFSYPFGTVNDVAATAAQESGYAHAVVGVGRTKPGDNPYRLPRQEVLGNFDIGEFIQLLGVPQKAPMLGRVKYRYRRLLRDRRTYMNF
jgi:peptidoglycan/xylan/chitin deacetylase (PgdA/CDA1 family)/ubiquinone/menaquinone biosynthesis C-methylase UbiE